MCASVEPILSIDNGGPRIMAYDDAQEVSTVSFSGSS